MGKIGLKRVKNGGRPKQINEKIGLSKLKTRFLCTISCKLILITVFKIFSSTLHDLWKVSHKYEICGCEASN